jgi:hypothetical protein
MYIEYYLQAPNNADALANLVCCHQNLQREKDAQRFYQYVAEDLFICLLDQSISPMHSVSRRQLKALHPNHSLVVKCSALESTFDQAAQSKQMQFTS